MNPQRTVLLALLIIGVFTAVIPVGAQDAQNLLKDGSFEGAYSGRPRPDLNIPNDWNVWVGASDPTAFPHRGPDPDPQNGTQAINFAKGFTTYTIAIYQQVSVAQGSNVRGSAFGWLHTCIVPENNEKCNSTPDSGAYIKVGIDPNGGTNPNDSDIVWSANASPHDRWQEITVDATATGGTVTLFIYTTQTSTPQCNDCAAHLNKAYFDNAKLMGGGGGGAAAGQAPAAPPAPTQPPTAPRVSAQGEQDDGSIVHRVQAGDTIDAIAVAYGVTRADILALNSISDPRIIAIGQELIVREATNPQPEEGEDGGGEGEADPEGEDGGEGEAGSSEDGGGEAEAAPESSGISPEDAPPAPVVEVASNTDLALTATLCVMMFDDMNQNRFQEDGEALVQGGTIVVRSGGEELNNYTTDGASEPICMDNLAAGDYVAVGAAPEGYGLTTPNQLLVRANPGATINIVFGAAQGLAQLMAPPPEALVVADVPQTEAETPTSNPIRDNLGLIVFGLAGVVLVAGAGASLLMRRR